MGPGCRIDPAAQLCEWAVLGNRTDLEKGVEIRRSILWDDVKVREGKRVIDSVVTSGSIVNRDLVGEIY